MVFSNIGSVYVCVKVYVFVALQIKMQYMQAD